MNFLNPRSDLVFKRLFGTEKNKDILIRFLNDILQRGTNPIEDVVFLSPVQNPEILSYRVSAVDVLCVDCSGDKFVIEMQVSCEEGFEERALYYACKTYGNQKINNSVIRGKERIDYCTLKKVTFIAILNYTLFSDDSNYLSRHTIKNENTNETSLKGLSFTFLELSKFKKKRSELSTVIEKWAYFFKRADKTETSEVKEIVGPDMIIEKAFEELSAFNWTADELRAYEDEKINEGAECGRLKAAIAEGRAEGLAEGLAEGMIEGEAIGLEKGKIEIAKRMLLKGISVEEISLLTDVPIGELEKFNCEY